VLVAHGDATSGYSLYLQDGHLVHDLNVGGQHQLLRSPRPVAADARRLAVAVTLGPWRPREGPGGARLLQPEQRVAALEVDGVEVARAPLAHGFATLISWSGLDIGLDRGSPVSHYDAPYGFTGTLRCVRYTLGPMFSPDDDARARAELARQ
jgi:hypothetical protein